MAYKKAFKKTAKEIAPIPFAINFKKLQRYNFDFFRTTEEIIIFEYLIVFAKYFREKYFKQEFSHSSARIQMKTGIKRTKLDTILDRFVRLKIISITVKGMPNIKYFKVDFKRIYSLLSKIYISEDGKLSADMRKLLTEYFKPLAEDSKL